MERQLAFLIVSSYNVYKFLFSKCEYDGHFLGVGTDCKKKDMEVASSTSEKDDGTFFSSI